MKNFIEYKKEYCDALNEEARRNLFPYCCCLREICLLDIDFLDKNCCIKNIIFKKLHLNEEDFNRIKQGIKMEDIFYEKDMDDAKIM